jgi:hypothetical protein
MGLRTSRPPLTCLDSKTPTEDLQSVPDHWFCVAAEQRRQLQSTLSNRAPPAGWVRLRVDEMICDHAANYWTTKPSD